MTVVGEDSVEVESIRSRGERFLFRDGNMNGGEMFVEYSVGEGKEGERLAVVDDGDGSCCFLWERAVQDGKVDGGLSESFPLRRRCVVHGGAEKILQVGRSARHLHDEDEEDSTVEIEIVERSVAREETDSSGHAGVELREESRCEMLSELAGERRQNLSSRRERHRFDEGDVGEIEEGERRVERSDWGGKESRSGGGEDVVELGGSGSDDRVGSFEKSGGET